MYLFEWMDGATSVFSRREDGRSGDAGVPQRPLSGRSRVWSSNGAGDKYEAAGDKLGGEAHAHDFGGHSVSVRDHSGGHANDGEGLFQRLYEKL